MKRILIALLASAVGLLPTPSGASHNADAHSDNIRLVTTWDHQGTYGVGSDIAFWKHRMVLGTFSNPSGFRLMNIKRPGRPELLGHFACPGSQADVSIWKKLVFVSVDAPMESANCGAPAASQTQIATGTHWEGLRIVSIDQPYNPVQIAAVNTDCGSHTNTVVPDLEHRDPQTGQKAPRLLVYVLSYPLTGQSVGRCNAETHRKISIVEVPLRNPASASVIGTPSVSPAIGCHDVTYFPQRQLAGAACISESQLWDVTDPARPRVISHIENPDINIHHSSAFSWDGNTLILGDELGGAVVAPGCRDGSSSAGALWFYDVSDPKSPKELSFYRIPQREPNSNLCTAHNFNVVPLRGQRDILVSAWYDAGTTVVDFTDPRHPTQIGYFDAREGRQSPAFSSYFYNRRIYVNYYDPGTSSRGMDVLQMRHGFVKRSLRLPYMNPQVQLPPPEPKKKRGNRKGGRNR